MDKAKIKALLIYENSTIKQAMQKLEETAEKILLVVDRENRMLGTVTDGDIRRGLMDGLQFADSIDKVTHGEFVSLPFQSPDITGQAKMLMVEKKIEHIPILTEDGIVKDIISWTSILSGEGKPQTRQKYSNDIVVMAGGKGTRLDPFTKILPKPLIPVGEKPIIEVIMENFYKCGFHKFIYTLNYKKEYMKLFLRENNFPYTLDWVEEDKYLGTAGGLSLLKGKLNESFFITNCDSVMNIDMADVLEWHKEHKAAITIVGCRNEFKIPFGVLEMNDGKLVKISEKPVHDVIINTGVYVMEPHVIAYLKDGEQKDMNELIDEVAGKERVVVYPIYSGWFDIGQWEEYKKVANKFEEKSDNLII